MIGVHTDYLHDMETKGFINRVIEFLPDEKELIERKATAMSLSRPELAVLLAYTKINLKHEILKTDIPDDPFLSQSIETAFPPSIRKKYKPNMQDHGLRRDIIATQLSNKIVNEMGITFVYRLQMETGARVEDIVRAHAIASRIYNTTKIEQLIEDLDFKISLNEQYDMLYNLRNLINLTTRWFLHHSKRLQGDLEEHVEHFSTRIKKMENLIPELMTGYTRDYLEKLSAKFVEAGIDKVTALQIAAYRAIYTSLNIVDISGQNNFDLLKTARVYFDGGHRINLVWFRDQIANDNREGHWNTLARLTLRDELDLSQRALTIAIMKTDKGSLAPKALVDQWMADNEQALERWNNLLGLLTSSTNIDYTMFFIAIRELWAVLQST